MNRKRRRIYNIYIYIYTYGRYKRKKRRKKKKKKKRRKKNHSACAVLHCDMYNSLRRARSIRKAVEGFICKLSWPVLAASLSSSSFAYFSLVNSQEVIYGRFGLFI